MAFNFSFFFLLIQEKTYSQRSGLTRDDESALSGPGDNDRMGYGHYPAPEYRRLSLWHRHYRLRLDEWWSPQPQVDPAFERGKARAPGRADVEARAGRGC